MFCVGIRHKALCMFESYGVRVSVGAKVHSQGNLSCLGDRTPQRGDNRKCLRRTWTRAWTSSL